MEPQQEFGKRMKTAKQALGPISPTNAEQLGLHIIFTRFPVCLDR